MVDEARLRSTTDAQVWTEEFLTVVPDADPGLMLGWLANAIEAGALREAARYEPSGWMCAWYEGAVAHRDHGNCDNDECEPLCWRVTEGEEG